MGVDGTFTRTCDRAITIEQLQNANVSLAIRDIGNGDEFLSRLERRINRATVLKAQRKRFERTRVEFERAVLEADIRAEITRASEILTLRLQHSRAIDASLKAAEELITIADVAYREGDIGILQLLDAYRTVARARERVIDAHLNLRLAQTALERAVGVTIWP